MLPLYGSIEYVYALLRLQPRGVAWLRFLPGQIALFLQGIADAVAVWHAWLLEVINIEAYPPTSIQLLPDWEAQYGLPDPCSPATATIQQRQAALLARMGAQGGQSIAYFTAVAANLGYPITVTEFSPFFADVGAAEQPLWDETSRFVWQVNASTVTETFYSAEVSAAEEPLWTITGSSLVCVLNRLKPAHTKIIYVTS